MLTSVLRVVSRAATIQLEEVAARHGPAALASRSRTHAPAPSDPSLYPPPPNAPTQSTPDVWERDLPPIRRGDRIDGEPLPLPKQNQAQAVEGFAGQAGAALGTPARRNADDREVEESLKQLEAMLGGSDGAPASSSQDLSSESKLSAANTKEDPFPDMLAAGQRPMAPPQETAQAGRSTPPTTDEQMRIPDQRTEREANENLMGKADMPKQEPSIETMPEQDLSRPPITETTGAGREETPISAGTNTEAAVDETEEAPVLLRASKVPSSKLGRLFHYGSLAASLSWGAASESIRRTAGGSSSQGSSVFMSDANVRRLVSSLTRMRGAALKLGQFMSIQDNNMLPPEIEKVLQQVQAHANYMPDWQMEKVMKAELGPDWTSLFTSFDRTPIASASIGQVHRAVLASTGETVAVKIQFPGIQESISSDLSYLTPLLASSSILPRGLYLQNTIAVMKRELADECDYIREAESGRKFAELLQRDEYFDVPKVVDEASSAKVLTTTWMEGKPLSRMKNMSQETRDKIGTNILRLCLIELFQFRFMQTDPNWANFLYNSSTDRLGLIDFGASREYTPEFMDAWHGLLTAALEGDREGMREQSLRIGYFTGEEEEVMVDAHLSSMSLLAVPFAHQGVYDFSKQTITTDVRRYIPIMLKHRLTPPPPETYSLNRKLSGAFLMCARLGSRVDCSALWRRYVAGYKKSGEARM